MPQSHAPDQLSGTVIDQRYRLDSLLGSGGTAAVYRGVDLLLGHTIAVKLLSPSRTGLARASFEAEARAASRVNHPNAVAIYDIGCWQNLPYLVMEQVPGDSLSTILESGPLSVDRVIDISVQILDALEEAHNCGVIHCDLSSDNIIVDESADHAQVKVIDFGLARLGAETQTERVAGTVEYLAPEQIRDELITPAADLYAVGILIYEMLVGRTPFAGSSPAIIAKGHLEATPTPPHEIVSSCPEWLGRLVASALAKSPAYRPESAAQMRDTITNVGAHRSRASSSQTSVLTRTSALLAREQQLEIVLEFLRHDAGALFIAGDEGLGKKRLVSELKQKLEPRVRLVTAAAPLMRTQASWSPITQLLSQILNIQQPTIALLTRAVARLGLPDRDVPGLAAFFGVGGSSELARDKLRAESLASLSRVVQASARRLPRTVVAFTDVDRFDPSSRDVALQLAQRAEAFGLAVILTGKERPEELRRATVHLKPLSAQHSVDLLKRLTGTNVPADLRLATTSSPARIEQLAAWIAEGHALQDAPEELVDLVVRRILNLAPADRRAVQALAVVGGSLAEEPLARLLDGAPVREIPALVVREDASLRLHSPLVARVAEACLPADARRALHLRALEFFGPEATPASRAQHAAAAGDQELAYSMYVKAGLEAFSRFDGAGAAAAYGRATECARELHQRGRDGAARQFIAAALFAAEALLDIDKPRLAEGLIKECASFEPRGSQQAACLRAQALALRGRGRWERAIELFENAIAVALASGDLELVCDAYLELSDTLASTNRGDRALVELQQAVDVTTGGLGWNHAGAPRRLWRVGHRLSELLAANGRHSEAREVAREALTHARRHKSINGQARLAAQIAQTCEALGDFASALRYRATAIKGLQGLGDRRSTAELLLASVGGSASQGPGSSAALALAEALSREIGWSEGVEEIKKLVEPKGE